MTERSGGSFWLDAVLYDSAPLEADALLDGTAVRADAIDVDARRRHSPDWWVPS